MDITIIWIGDLCEKSFVHSPWCHHSLFPCGPSAVALVIVSRVQPWPGRDICHWIGLREHLQETMVFPMFFPWFFPWNMGGGSCKCSQQSILRMGPTLIQHFGMSQLQFGTLTTAFAMAKPLRESRLGTDFSGEKMQDFPAYLVGTKTIVSCRCSLKNQSSDL